MSKRRLERPRPQPGRRRQQRTRPRYGRLTAAALSLAVTVVTLLGGLGVLPTDSPAAASSSRSENVDVTATWAAAALSSTPTPAPVAPAPVAAATQTKPAQAATPSTAATGLTALPQGSGTGRRVVFDLSAQRVWLVRAGDHVARTYLVSGSLTKNLRPGTFAVYSRSRHAVGIDNSGEMEYFVRFTRGVNAAIGFHSIPTKDGRPLQTIAQLGTPQSHGCIRQALPDAVELWNFAPEGTKVVVTA